MQLGPSLQRILVRAAMDHQFRNLLWNTESSDLKDVTAQDLEFIRTNRRTIEPILQGLEQKASSLAMADFCTPT